MDSILQGFLSYDPRSDKNDQLRLSICYVGISKKPPDQGDVREERHFRDGFGAICDEDPPDNSRLAVGKQDIRRGLIRPDGRLARSALD